MGICPTFVDKTSPLFQVFRIIKPFRMVAAERIMGVSRRESEIAAYLWIHAASHPMFDNVQYCFVGEFQRTRMDKTLIGETLRTHCLEILVDCSLNEIHDRFSRAANSIELSPYLTQTTDWNSPTAEPIRLIMPYAANRPHGKHYKGVEVRFIQAGTDYYPPCLTPPGVNPQPDVWEQMVEPSFYLDIVVIPGCTTDAPVLRPLYSLIQKAKKFPTLTDDLEKRRAVKDVKLFMEKTVECHDRISRREFTQAEAQYLTPFISFILEYGNKIRLRTTPEELISWQELGLSPL